uniref:Bro-N domain-containing protein n=1 Tax=Anticarsia gemmatalis multiple nucleopolyhedrovirus TaxID=268591 RepID=A0A0S3J0H7_9ABAC|nr:hypothetical protein AGNV_157 [Anticarsia gemmatalis multiple nucleopolyhedrovirus]ALR71531.1 hypothetical protein AGNV_157 [Anticarsia gemmatalis multiple nucleopolyhedrovirus]
MALSKVNFVNGPLEVFTVADDKRENWMVANPFAEALKYSKPNKAILEKVSSCNQKTYEELRSYRIGTTQITSSMPKEVQAKISLSTLLECSSSSTRRRCPRPKSLSSGTPTICCPRCARRASTAWRWTRPLRLPRA